MVVYDETEDEEEDGEGDECRSAEDRVECNVAEESGVECDTVVEVGSMGTDWCDDICVEYTGSNDCCGDWGIERLTVLDGDMTDVNEMVKNDVVFFEFR